MEETLPTVVANVYGLLHLLPTVVANVYAFLDLNPGVGCNCCVSAAVQISNAVSGIRKSLKQYPRSAFQIAMKKNNGSQFLNEL